MATTYIHRTPASSGSNTVFTLSDITDENLVVDSIESMVKKVQEYVPGYKLKQEVQLNGNPLTLSTTEFEALLIFAENCGQVLNRDFLVENLRGISWQSYDRSIDVLVSRLRNKLQKLDPATEYIKTIHGVGYKFIDRIKK